MLGAGGAGAKLQTGSKGSSPEMSLLALNPGVVAPLQICFAESNYCRAGLQGSEETHLHLGERVQVPDLRSLGLQRLWIIWEGVWLTLCRAEIVPATLLQSTAGCHLILWFIKHRWNELQGECKDAGITAESKDEAKNRNEGRNVKQFWMQVLMHPSHLLNTERVNVAFSKEALKMHRSHSYEHICSVSWCLSLCSVTPADHGRALVTQRPEVPCCSESMELLCFIPAPDPAHCSVR